MCYVYFAISLKEYFRKASHRHDSKSQDIWQFTLSAVNRNLRVIGAKLEQYF